MENVLVEVTPLMVGAAALVMGLVQFVAKKFISARYVPLAAIALSEVVVFLASIGATSKEMVLSGLVVALISMGAWSGTKTTVQG